MANGLTANGALRAALVAIAGLPDSDPAVAGWLQQVPEQAAGLIAPVSFASVTAFRDGAASTVALSSDIALALDEAQYADGLGPCLEALERAAPSGLSNISATVVWPRFRDVAATFGLHASLSVPLFAGHGLPVAALNLFAYERHALDELTDAVVRVFGRPSAATSITTAHRVPVLDAGGQELVTGLTEAIVIQTHIQRALSMLTGALDLPTDLAYVELRRRSVATGASLYATASSVLDDFRPALEQTDGGASS